MALFMMRTMVRPRIILLAFLLALSVVYLVFHRPPLALQDAITATEAWKIESGYISPSSATGNVPASVVKEPAEAAAKPSDRPAPDEKGSTTSTITDESPEAPKPTEECKAFETLQRQKPEPLSEGRRKFPYVRPPPHCRTFNLPSMEALIKRMKTVIRDPDLFRLFENSYPNTLDTMVKWRGYANKTDPDSGNQTRTDEELTYVITGDIDAMWLRDSASQIHSYFPLLEASDSPDSLASLWRGLINSHARYITISPYCHSFQPPKESGITPTHNGAYSQNNPQPPYDPQLVFDCKWELDSLASFLQVSVDYFKATKDAAFFGKYSWLTAVEKAVQAAGAMRLGTYDESGKVLKSAWTFTGWTNRGSETLTNDGLGNPTHSNGMVRVAFRPSDDATIYQLLTPANMMWAKYLEEASLITAGMTGERAANLTASMREQAKGIRQGIDTDAVVDRRGFGDVFAYEVDGFGSTNMMDDANVPSLLAMPLWGYGESAFGLPRNKDGSRPKDLQKVYQNTRKFILGPTNPYWAKGPVLSAIGGPHLGPGKGWPMAAIVAAMTAMEPFSGVKDVEKEVESQLRQVLDSTTGTGVIHETVSAWDEQIWTRSWFGWANGMFGELILKLEQYEKEKKRGSKGLLSRLWQEELVKNGQ